MRLCSPFLIVPALLVFLSPIYSTAQYFGQNKVRYKKLDFKVLKTKHFDIYYYPEESNMATQVGRMSERWYTRLSNIFNHDLSSRQPVIMYASAPDFRSTNVIPGDIGEATGGVTEPLRRRVVIPLAGPLADTDHVLGHELVHAFQYDISLGSRAQSNLGNSPLQRLPLWFIEGMAEYLSLGPIDPNTAMWMRDAVAQDKLPKIKDLNNPKYFPYRWGQALWAYIGGTYGEQTIGQLQNIAGRSGDALAALTAVLHQPWKEISDQWQQALRRQYSPVIEESFPADKQGRVLVSKEHNGGGSTLNTSPVLSPDGKKMVFFSARELFAVNLFLANGETGQIEKKLTSAAVSPHLESLEFINSAGAWSRDGRYLAMGETVSGFPQLAIRDMQEGKTVQTIRLKNLGEIYTPTWSPDGKQIAFSALVNGVTDLFVVDLQTQNVRRLTNDAFADLQPAWSPDGSTIAFATDRFGTQLSDLDYEHFQLALLRVADGAITPVPGFDSGKHINPEWAPDGKSLYFVSDRDGVDNIYRVELAGSRLFQITNLQTGITGITPTSPAFSVAAKTGRLVFSAFVKDDYNIYSIDSPAALVGAPPGNALNALSADALPPAEKNRNSPVTAMLNNYNKGLPQTTEDFRRTDYKPSLGLDYVAPLNVGVGYSSFGSMVAGGTGLYFSDLLNQESLLVSFQTSNFGNTNAFYRNLSGIGEWINQKSRWDWGFIGGQVPYITAGVSQGVVNVGGQTALAEQDITFWQLNRQLSFIAAYPFSRARRVEFSAGYNNIGFAANAQTFLLSPVDGSVLGVQTQDLPAPSALNLATASAALVYDTSVFAGTSPIMGQRYRLEVDGAGGTLNFSTLLGDYRRYFRVKGPFSLAGRVLHYGRYGGDADDQRLQDIFLGYPSLVHGYDPNSFSTSECGAQFSTSGSCPVFDNLIGSKMGVVNAEARLELLGPLGAIPSKAIPPVQAAWFYDGGVAWTGFDKPSVFGGGRDGVSSYGGALRINLLGYAVAEISLAHPNDRPQKNWLWQFSLIPGW
jgi:hypothetical protein